MKTALPRTFLFLAALSLYLMGMTHRSAASPSIDAQLAKLKDADAEVRVEALRELQTSVDPRLPEAMLKLLADEGDSIRRLAARGVGSRWWQIPKANVGAYVKALQRNEKSEREDEVNMVHRALALLNRDYRDNMLARSANQRWVIYERRGLPCLIDTATGTEELLGYEKDGAAHLSGAWGNGTLEGGVFWHPKEELAGLDIGIGRKGSEVWIWRHRAGVRRLGATEMLKTLGVPERVFHPGGGFFTEIKEWKGDELRFEVSFTTMKKEEFIDRTATMGWNAVKQTLRVISK
jgi:hypothetical protein